MLNSIYIVFLLLLGHPKTQEISVSQAEKVLSTSVLIRAKQYAIEPQSTKIRKGMVGCSGTFVSGDTVLTAAHCFSNPTTEIWVRGQDFNISYKATLLKLDADNDLALLQIHKLKNHPFAIVGEAKRQGEQVLVVGSPYMFEFLLSEGVVARIRHSGKPFKSSYLIHTGMINSGSSGGGAFNADGELIGVNVMTVGGFFGWAGISMAVDGAVIKEFLK